MTGFFLSVQKLLTDLKKALKFGTTLLALDRNITMRNSQEQTLFGTSHGMDGLMWSLTFSNTWEATTDGSGLETGTRTRTSPCSEIGQIGWTSTTTDTQWIATHTFLHL